MTDALGDLVAESGAVQQDLVAGGVEGVASGLLAREIDALTSPSGGQTFVRPRPLITTQTRLESRLPAIATQIKEGVGPALAKTTADRVAGEARIRCPVRTGALRDSIRVRKQRGRDSYTVAAGSREVFYAKFVEWGTVNTAAQPFLLPAAESVKTEVEVFGVAGW